MLRAIPYRFILCAALAAAAVPAAVAGPCDVLRGEEGLAACTAMLMRNPNDFVAYDIRGTRHLEKGDNDAAIVDFDQAIRLKPDYAAAYVNRGSAWHRKGDLDRAITDADAAIRIDPAYASAWSSRARSWNRKRDYAREIADAYEARRDYDRALASYEAALKIRPLEYAWRGRERVAALLAQRSDPPVQAAPAQTAPGPAPTRRALGIAINAYPNLGAVARLERAVADANAVGDKLAALDFEVTRLTTAPQTTLAAVIRGFDAFLKTVAPNDMVVLFDAGYGLDLADGTYLVPGDAREANLEVEATARLSINENELTDGLRRAHAGIVVAVIDACRNDVFAHATARGLNNERGLRPVETAGILKLYFASEGKTALDCLPGSDGSRNSVFTRVFLKALATFGLNLNTLGATVRDEVHELARKAGHEQTHAVYDKRTGSTRVYLAGQVATVMTTPGAKRVERRAAAGRDDHG